MVWCSLIDKKERNDKLRFWSKAIKSKGLKNIISKAEYMETSTLDLRIKDALVKIENYSLPEV